jgi:hypothetical protein
MDEHKAIVLEDAGEPASIPPADVSAPAGSNGDQDREIDALREPVEIILDYPIDFDGRHYDRLVFNFKSIRRKTWKSIRRTFKELNPNEFNPEPIDHEDYQALVAAEAAQVPLLLMDAIDPLDWGRVHGVTILFLGKRLDPRLTRPK